MSHIREHKTHVDKYINELFAVEDEHLKQIRLKLREDEKEGINVGPYEGKLLQFLVSLHNVKNIVEVGTLYGYSALWMARGLPEDGKIYCLELDPGNAEKAKALLDKTEVAHKIEIIQGDALESLEKLSAKGPFDMAFIDANKAGYLNYLNWAEENIREQGLIIGDNTFLFGNIFDDKNLASMNANEKQISVMKEFNKRLADPNKYNSIIIPTAEGMTLAQKVPG